MKCLMIIFLLLSSSAFATQAYEAGKITRLMVHNNPSGSTNSQTVVVFLDGEMSGGFCPKKNWSFNLNNKAAEAQYSMLVASYMAGISVEIVGNPSQDCVNEYENVRNVEFH